MLQQTLDTAAEGTDVHQDKIAGGLNGPGPTNTSALNNIRWRYYIETRNASNHEFYRDYESMGRRERVQEVT